MIERVVSEEEILASWERRQKSNPSEVNTTHQIVSVGCTPLRKEIAIEKLRCNLSISDDYTKVIKEWTGRYIHCSRCRRGFLAWYERYDPGPEDDLETWLQAAESIITEKRWI